MKRVGKILGSAAKWAGILVVLFVAFSYLSGMDFETRIGWFIAGLALAIAYVDGSLKDRISNLEYRIEQLNRQLNGWR